MAIVGLPRYDWQQGEPPCLNESQSARTFISANRVWPARGYPFKAFSNSFGKGFHLRTSLSNYPKTALTRFSVNRLDSPWLFQGGQGWPGNARNARQPRRLAPFGKSLMTCGIAFVRSS